MKGRKRHIVVDTLGLLLAVAVHPANIQDRDGAKLVLERMLGQYPWLKVIWADGAYGGKLVQWAKEVGQGSGWLESGTGAPAPAATYFPGTAPALGGGTHLRLAELATAFEQGL